MKTKAKAKTRHNVTTKGAEIALRIIQNEWIAATGDDKRSADAIHAWSSIRHLLRCYIANN